MAIHGKERNRVIFALVNELPYKAGSALTIVKEFKGWGMVRSDHPNINDIRTWVYSYETPIAWVDNNGIGHVPDRKYSVTTTHHQHLCRCYLAGSLPSYFDPTVTQEQSVTRQPDRLSPDSYSFQASEQEMDDWKEFVKEIKSKTIVRNTIDARH